MIEQVLELEGEVLTSALFVRGDARKPGAVDVLLPRDTWEKLGFPTRLRITLEEAS